MNHSPLVDTAIVGMLGAAAALADPLGQDVFENRELFYLVILGGLGGAYVATALFTRPDATRRQLAARLFTSALVSILFTPWLIDVMNLKTTRGTVLGVSGAVAIIGVAVIKGTVAAWTTFFIKRFSPPDAEGYRSERFQPRPPTQRLNPNDNPNQNKP